MKKYGLTKPEIDELAKILNVLLGEQLIVKALRESYQVYVMGTIFKRLSIEPEMFRFSKFDLNVRELIINEPKKDVRKSGDIQTKRPTK